MKISPKQIAVAILCVIIALIPTYIAITYYFIERDSASENYQVTVTDNNGTVLAANQPKIVSIKRIEKPAA